jgi:ankyrin repeat protein
MLENKKLPLHDLIQALAQHDSDRVTQTLVQAHKSHDYIIKNESCFLEMFEELIAIKSDLNASLKLEYSYLDNFGNESFKAPNSFSIRVIDFLLLNAVAFGFFEAVKILLQHGADVHIRDHSGLTVLMIIGRNSYLYRSYQCNDKDCLKIMQLLVDHGADIKAVDNYGNTVLEAEINNLYAVEFLLKQGIDQDIITKALRSAVGDIVTNDSKDFLSVIELLLQHGARVNDVDDDGDNALILIIEFTDFPYRNLAKAVKLLLQYGADVYVQNKNGSSSLDIARELGNQEIITILEAYSKNKN